MGLPGCTGGPGRPRLPRSTALRPALRRRTVPPSLPPAPVTPLRCKPRAPFVPSPAAAAAPSRGLSPGVPAPPSRPRPCRSPQPGSVAEESPERSAARPSGDAAATARARRPTPRAILRDGPRELRGWTNQRVLLSKNPKEAAERANRNDLEAGLKGRVRRALKAPRPPHPPVGRHCPIPPTRPALTAEHPTQKRALCDPAPTVTHLRGERDTPPQEFCTARACRAGQLIIEGDPIITSCRGE